MTDVPKFELEVFRRIQNNVTGEYIQIGPDADGLGLIEIIDSSNKTRLVFHKNQITHLINALEGVLTE